MKIAVASEGNIVTGHFGHCQNFNIYEVTDKEIISFKSIPNPGHKPGFLPNFLNDLGVNIIISGGMGGGAVEIFNQKGIKAILGVKGDAKEAVESYIKGDLKSTNSICNSHEHHGEC